MMIETSGKLDVVRILHTSEAKHSLGGCLGGVEINTDSNWPVNVELDWTLSGFVCNKIIVWSDYL